MIRLIATDLDGTVLGPDFRFRPRTLEAFAAARDAGVDLMFVTGRPIRWVEPVFEQFPYDSLAICSNGAVLYDFGADEVVSSEFVPVPTVLDLRRRLLDVLDEPQFSVEALEGVFSDPNWDQTNLIETNGTTRGPLEEILDPDLGVVKFLVRDDTLEPRDLYERVAELAGDAVSVTHSIAHLPLAEIGQAGLSKGRTLARWCAEQGIAAEDVAAFGDMPNDVAMLQWAGHGYAMASGWPEVIDAVGRTCPGFDEDGVAQTIEKLLADG